MTYRELIYMILDQARLVTDDISLNEEHVLFLLDNVRNLLLAQKYKTIKTEVLEDNYQTLCLDLEEVESSPCEGMYIRSKVKLPDRLKIGNDIVSPYNYYGGINISLVPRERMRYAGKNKFLQNIIYCSFGPDGYLYFKSNNPQFQYLSKVKLTAVFSNTVEASKYECDRDCNLLDRDYPFEEDLVPNLIDAIVKTMVGAAYRPKDESNSANDDTGRIGLGSGSGDRQQ